MREPALQQVLGGQRADRLVIALDGRHAPRPGPWSLRSTVGMPVRADQRVRRGVRSVR